MAWCEKTGFALPSRPAPVSCFTRRAFRAALLAGTALVSVASAVTAARAGDLASLALPTGGQVTAGQAAISQNGAAMTVTQSSPKAILTWQGFDIGKQASVTFNQPDASSMALNRVVAGNASRIEGQLSANGQVILVNPNGVVFGAGATVNVGGLVASALNIADADFLTGNLAFQRGGATGAVVSRFNASATVQGSGGSLRVDSQNTAFHGRAAATGGAQGGDGGQVETSGARLDIASALVDVGAPHGKVGSWLLDPIDFVVDANAATAIDNGLANGDVTIWTTASGNTVTGAAASSGANPGSNGDIVVAAPISWTSGQALTLDAYHSVQVNAAVSGSGTNASGTNASGTGAGLVITTNDGGSGGSLSFGGGGSVNVSTSGNITVGNNASNVGGLVGDNNGGRVSASFASGSVSVGSGATGIGGLIGNNENGAIVQATYATGSVGAGSGSQNVGGLVGANDGTSSIDQSYATGLVAADATATNVGGLVGSNSGSVTSSYWDMASTGQATSAAGTGLAVTDDWGTVGPQADTTWTSSGNWHFVDGKRYPLLAAFNGGARNPTPAPTVAPTPAPTAAPTPAPTAAPTPAPTAAPTPAPTVAPTPAPTDAPTPAPTVAPTPAPTDAPTPAPTDAPTPAPTVAPTPAPTVAPTPAPTVAPTVAPTPAPTTAPTPAPTAAPSPAPTVAPTPAPTVAPTPIDLTPALPTPGPTAPISPARPVIPVADAGADDPATQAIFAPLSATYEGQAETGEPRRELSMSQRNPAEATASRPTPETPTQCATDHGPSQTCSSVPAELRKVLGLAGNLGWIVQFNDESVAIPSGTPED